MRSTCFASALALWLLTAGSAGAQSLAAVRFDPGIERAEAVIEGEVVRIETESLEWAPAGRRIPFTLVTWRVSETFKGDPAEEVTLRFAGGPTEDGRLVLRVSHVPRFEIGDRDFLFVQEGTRSTPAVPSYCPLVHCRQGRLRVMDGAVHGAEGAPLEAGETVSPQLLRGMLRDRVDALSRKSLPGEIR